MTNYEPPEIDVQQLMTGIRESLSKRNLSERRLQSSFPTAKKKTSEPEVPDLKLSPDFQVNSDNRYHVNDLLKYHDREFVRNAYRAILKREPDDAGYRSYLESLREGSHNKIDVLARLRFSSEGEQKNVTIDGLKFAADMRRFGRVPVLGYLFQLFAGIFRLPASAQERRRFESYALNQQREIAEHINRLAAVLRNLESFADEMPVRIEEQARNVSAQFQNFSVLVDQQRDLLSTLSQAHGEELTQQERRISVQEAELVKQGAAHGHLAEHFAGRFAQEAAERTALAASLNEQLMQSQSELQKHALEAERFALSVQQVRSELAVQQARMSSLLGSITKAAPTSKRASAFREEEAHMLDSLYVSLEDRFRGSRHDLKQNLKVYLPHLKKAGIASNILDVGCGRGEWLELLKEEGLEARGVDNNRSMIEQCKTAGLEAVVANAIDYLRGLPDQSLSAVTSFHVIEHLEFKSLLEMIDEIIRVLKPGGVVIFETPNPENVLVGSCNFYLDPSHKNPLPGQYMQFLLETRGLTNVEVLPLHPWTEERIAGDSEVVQRFNDMFYGPMDYAIIGYRA